MPLFADVPETALRQIASHAELWLVGSGTDLIRQGEPADAVYLIQAVHAQVVVKTAEGAEDVVDTIGPGEPAGELGLLAGMRRSATVRTVEPVVAVVLRADAFLAAMQQTSFAQRQQCGWHVAWAR
jgi:CRP-like cAMP-binding protein